MDAFAHSTALAVDDNPLAYDMFVAANLEDEVLISIVMSSIPSFPKTDHPLLVNPLTASLKPLLSLWANARNMAGLLPQPLTFGWETSWEISLRWRKAYVCGREEIHRLVVKTKKFINNKKGAAAKIITAIVVFCASKVDDSYSGRNTSSTLHGFFVQYTANRRSSQSNEIKRTSGEASIETQNRMMSEHTSKSKWSTIWIMEPPPSHGLIK